MKISRGRTEKILIGPLEWASLMHAKFESHWFETSFERRVAWGTGLKFCFSTILWIAVYVISCVFLLSKLLLKTQEACSSFRCQSKPNNIEGQPRSKFFLYLLFRARPFTKPSSRLLLMSHSPELYHMQTHLMAREMILTLLI